METPKQKSVPTSVPESVETITLPSQPPDISTDSDAIENTVKLELELLVKLQLLRGSNDNMELEMKVFGHEDRIKQSNFNNAAMIRNNLLVLSDGINNKNWEVQHVRKYLLDVGNGFYFMMFLLNNKTVEELYHGAKPDGLCFYRTVHILQERRKCCDEGALDSDKVKDLNLMIPEDRGTMLSHLNSLKGLVESKAGVVTADQLSNWKGLSRDVIKRIGNATGFVTDYQTAKKKFLSEPGWMIVDANGLFFNDSCQVSCFTPVSNRDDEMQCRLHTCSHSTDNVDTFPLAVLQNVTRKPNNYIYKEHHFFPMETRHDDSDIFSQCLDSYCSLLIDLFATSKCFLYYFVQFHVNVLFPFLDSKVNFISLRLSREEYANALKLHWMDVLNYTNCGVDFQVKEGHIAEYEGERLKRIIR